jgi:hypothetical protein
MPALMPADPHHTGPHHRIDTMPTVRYVMIVTGR